MKYIEPFRINISLECWYLGLDAVLKIQVSLLFQLTVLVYNLIHSSACVKESEKQCVE